MASEITPEALRSGVDFLPLSAGLAIYMPLATMMLAVAAIRLGWLPAGAALVGLSPGAAAPMVILSESYGSDPRIVATMQYLRVIAAAQVAIAIGAVLVVGSSGGCGGDGAVPQARAVKRLKGQVRRPGG